MMKGKGRPIENTRDQPCVTRCGHGHPIAACPWKYCAARALLKALQTIDRQNMSGHPVGHDAFMAGRAAIRLAGEKPAPEFKPKTEARKAAERAQLPYDAMGDYSKNKGRNK
jgi:hypothetical protein